MKHDIRPARATDFDALRDALDEDDRDYFRRWPAGATSDGAILVSLADGEPAGVVVVFWGDAEEEIVRRHLPRVPILYRLRVRPAHRRRQHGTALVRRAEALLLDAGHARVLVGVDRSNDLARRFYLGRGYWQHPGLRDLPGGAEPFDVLVADLRR